MPLPSFSVPPGIQSAIDHISIPGEPVIPGNPIIPGNPVFDGSPQTAIIHEIFGFSDTTILNTTTLDVHGPHAPSSQIIDTLFHETTVDVLGATGLHPDWLIG